jgi:hypothetical protein
VGSRACFDLKNQLGETDPILRAFGRGYILLTRKARERILDENSRNSFCLNTSYPHQSRLTIETILSMNFFPNFTKRPKKYIPCMLRQKTSLSGVGQLRTSLPEI